MKAPNFLIIGAAKAGTTSLYDSLAQHPQIYMSPEKEPRFFAPEFYTTDRYGPVRAGSRRPAMNWQEYKALFAGASEHLAVGEATTEYLYFPETPRRIKATLPDVKLIAILRDPAERAFSAYCYQARDGRELLSFEQAIQQEEKRLSQHWRPGWLYLHSGFYYRQLMRYIEVFAPEQIQVYLYDDLQRDAAAMMQDIFRFLGVDADLIPTMKRKNVSRMPKNQFINRLLAKDSPLKATLKPLLPKGWRQQVAKTIRCNNLAAKPQLAPETRQKLISIYREDILKLQDLLKRDLSAWLV